jgi:Reverse transcriptase (RNA-dependent DNA polymerase)
LKGKNTRQRFKVATVYIDHFSNLSFVYLQTSTSAAETVDSKKEFERYARSNGVQVMHYHADNGRFSDKAWRDHVVNMGQTLSFCGVSAHHQNGRAEKRIRDLQDLARTSLIHASRRWPDVINAYLWPYALRHANDCINAIPRRGEKESPVAMFTNGQMNLNLKQQHPFGCPAYVLDGRLQNQRKIDKWSTRARVGVYLGESKEHARSVGLVLSLKTGLVSPQYHVKYDESFETVKVQDIGRTQSEWQKMCGFTQTNEDDTIELDAGQEGVSEMPPVCLPIVSDQREQYNRAPTDGDEVADTPSTQVTRSGRVTRPPMKFKDFISHEAREHDDDEIAIDFMDPTAYAASNDPDILRWKQALQEPDREQFAQAMEKEIDSHTENDNWMLIPRENVPAGQRVLPAIWAMRRKRKIDTREVYKWKARINVHGGCQEKGVNFWETYAPVAAWSSIRLLLVCSAIKGWNTKQLDFVLAYPQAPVETDIFMEIPPGFESTDGGDKVIHLINNLYGQKQAGRVWNQYLVVGLTKIGFVQSKIDPCIFWRRQTILIIYTDDTIVTGPTDADIDAAITDIGTIFVITHNPEVTDFLGVKITRADGQIHLTQPHLIDSIVNDIGLQKHSNSSDTPAMSNSILHKHEGGQRHDVPWAYRSVIGKLNYLEKSSRPDIAYAVHQCARFCEEPMKEHSQAVKRIGRYLCGTSDKGLTFTPKDESFEVYADADFAGNWNKEIAEHDTSTAKSRSGYVIKYANCPIVWASKLQTEIALSSTESEYVSLSQALREVIPMMALIEELAKAGFHINTTDPKVHCKAFEDNSGAAEMARLPKMRPRTKHMNIKYHHFRSAVEEGKISIHAISTHDQVADIFTKPLAPTIFKKFRELIMGW